MPIPGQPPQAGMPPSPAPQIAPGPAGVGPATVPQGNAGNTQAAIVKVKNAVKMLQEALPDIPMGEALHTDVLNATKSLSKHVSQEAGNKGLELQSLIQMAKQSAQSAPMNAMNRMFSPPNPTQPPAMQPPTGAAA